MLNKVALLLFAIGLFAYSSLWGNPMPSEGLFVREGDASQRVELWIESGGYDRPYEYHTSYSYVPEVWRGKIEDGAITEVVLLQHSDMILFEDYSLDPCVLSGYYCYFIPASFLWTGYISQNYVYYWVPSHPVPCKKRGTPVEMSNDEFESHKVYESSEDPEGSDKWGTDFDFDHAGMDVQPMPDDAKSDGGGCALVTL